MIGQLTGFVTFIEHDHCLIDVQGVGYLVFASTRTLSQLNPPPEVTKILIETHVREDAIQLFGFITPQERAWFRLLTTVQGVGSKAALAILSVSSPIALYQGVQMNDKSVFTQASGIGPKIAARLLVELKGKIEKIPDLIGGGEKLSFQPVAPQQKNHKEADSHEAFHHQMIEDAVMALEGLGFKRSEAWPIVQNILTRKENIEEETISLDDLIRQSLKELAK